LTDLPFTEKPRLVNAGQGFSILKTVEYKNRFLYSKYDPLKTITATIANMNLLPETLVIVCSPCLWYGLDQLLEKLPARCMILAIESDTELFSLAQTELSQKKATLSPEQCSCIHLMSVSSLEEVETFIRSNGGQGMLRRALRIDFSAGTSFSPRTYDDICDFAESTIAQFWKNRLTLTRLGRLYARNIFRNLSVLPLSYCLDNDISSIGRPILVCGAGEGLEHTLAQLCSESSGRNIVHDYYILATDAALPALVAHHITPDAVVGVECQAAIEKAYIGFGKSKIPLFADITSRPQIGDILGGNIVWFSTQYTSARYLTRLHEDGIISEFIPPLGSVGLVAVYISLRIRRNANVPVFVSGLDFSFTCGATHAKGTPAHLSRLSSSTRYVPVENFDASFRTGAIALVGKNNKLVRTDAALQGYAALFKSYFLGTPNLFDAGPSGLDIGIPTATDEVLFAAIVADNKQLDALTTDSTPAVDCAMQKDLSHKIARFYRKERHALIALKDLLMNGDSSEYRDLTVSLNEQLIELLRDRDYLYIHFPDGYTLSTDVGFLKRIRAEIDFFLKDIDFALARNHTLSLDE
jgi:hypothetical protein